MKKIILSAAVAAAAIFGGYTASQQSEMGSSDMFTSSDIEAIANPEDGDPSSENHLTGPRTREQVKITITSYI